MIPRKLYIGATLSLLLASITSCTPAPAPAAVVDGVPSFEVEPAWPPILPNKWVIGEVRGIFVDPQDHIWVSHLPGALTARETGAAADPPISECCIPAPSVIEFDRAGNVVQAWGGPGEGYDWLPDEHGMFVDHNGFVWIGGTSQHHIMKFTRDGKHVLTIGGLDAGKGSNDTTRLGGPANFTVDPNTNEVFVADGYINHRVIVFDAETGAYRRHWGAYGDRPDDSAVRPHDPKGPPSRQFSNVHGIFMSRDGLLYVADRANDRIQVFRPNGEFVTERIVAPETLGSGTAFSITLSTDPEQRFLYLADGTNNKIWILRRDNLEIVGQFGHFGRNVGQFFRAHMLGVDSDGNLYTGEAGDGKRLQKFAFRGLVAP